MKSILLSITSLSFFIPTMYACKVTPNFPLMFSSLAIGSTSVAAWGTGYHWAIDWPIVWATVVIFMIEAITKFGFLLSFKGLLVPTGLLCMSTLTDSKHLRALSHLIGAFLMVAVIKNYSQ